MISPTARFIPNPELTGEETVTFPCEFIVTDKNGRETAVGYTNVRVNSRLEIMRIDRRHVSEVRAAYKAYARLWVNGRNLVLGREW